jgi:hypothetical protein
MMSETVQVTTVDVETHPSQGDARVIDGTSAMLVASEAGIWVSMHTAELEMNHIYTLWVVVINNPEACASNCNA